MGAPATPMRPPAFAAFDGADVWLAVGEGDLACCARGRVVAAKDSLRQSVQSVVDRIAQEVIAGVAGAAGENHGALPRGQELAAGVSQ